jgi:formylglycine-generating enzyme
MKKLYIVSLSALLFIATSCSKRKEIKNLVFVKGGAFVNTKSNYYGKGIKTSDFYIGKYEVTQKEWVTIMGNNPSEFLGDNLPVENVNWYDCIEYCNKRSLKEGLKAYYTLNKNKKDPNNDSDEDLLKWTVTINEGANGYRLPTEQEWEYAAGGGQMSKNYTYSGSNNINNVAWYWRNSGDRILTGANWDWNTIQSNHCKKKPIGGKKPNELELYDMSGNVREWCWDWKSENVQVKGRAWKGGAWAGGEYVVEPSFISYYTPDVPSSDLGFRVCREE